MMGRLVLIVLVTLSWNLVHAEGLEVQSEGPVIWTTHTQLTVHSKVLDRDFQIRISPPLTSAKDEKPAAVYVLDANALYGMAVDTFRFQTFEGRSWPTYIVAIGYDTTNPAVVVKARETDYLHSRHEQSGRPAIGGGGALFEEFLLKELKPFIEERYRVDPAKSFLAGFSYGGLFVTNVLLRRPEAFAGYRACLKFCVRGIS